MEKQDLLIWKDKKYNFFKYIISVIAIFIVLSVGLVIIQMALMLANINQKSIKLYEIIGIFKVHKFLFIFTVLTAAVVEELIFRGYLQPRFEIIFRSPLLGILVSSLLFGLMHYKYGTVINIAGPLFIGLVFSSYYWKYRNIKILIVCHFLWDFISVSLLLRQQ